jgi:hypothetical protein
MSRENRKNQEIRDLEGYTRSLEKLNKKLKEENNRLRRELQKRENIETYGVFPKEDKKEVPQENDDSIHCSKCKSKDTHIIEIPFIKGIKKILTCHNCGHRESI